MGTKTVPVENPLTISGGLNPFLEGFDYNSSGGLSITKQKVPGGVVGLTGLTWLLELFGSEALTLYGISELAGNPSNFNFGTVTCRSKFTSSTQQDCSGITVMSAAIPTRSSST